MNKKHYRIQTPKYKAKRIFYALLRSYRSHVARDGVDLDDEVVNFLLDSQAIYLQDGIDVLLNELSIFAERGIWEVSTETWDYIVDVDEVTDDE